MGSCSTFQEIRRSSVSVVNRLLLFVSLQCHNVLPDYTTSTSGLGRPLGRAVFQTNVNDGTNDTYICTAVRPIQIIAIQQDSNDKECLLLRNSQLDLTRCYQRDKKWPEIITSDRHSLYLAHTKWYNQASASPPVRGPIHVRRNYPSQSARFFSSAFRFGCLVQTDSSRQTISHSVPLLNSPTID